MKFGTADGHVGPLGRAKFHANQYPGWERGPKMAKISTFGKESPRRGEHFHRFLQLLGTFIRPVPAVSHLTRFASQVTELLLRETARRSFAPDFSVAPCRKNYPLDRKMVGTF